VGILEVFEFQLDAASRADYRLSIGRGQNFFFLHDASANVIEMAAGVLLVYRI
jgi:hypothetical protein